MKSRILKVLIQFSENDIQEPALSMAKTFKEELGLDTLELQQKSQKILKHLLNNYALFSVETIDHFNHRLLRTFSRDLGLNSNFEVSLETSLLLSEAVDLVIDQAGEEPLITKWLVQYALQKTEEDKSWDISRELNSAAKLLTQENDLFFMEKLRGQSLEAFAILKNKLHEEVATFENELKLRASKLLERFHLKELDASHFSRGTLYNYFQKIIDGNTDLNLSMSWQAKVGIEPLYNKGYIDTPVGNAIEELVPTITTELDWLRANYPTYLKHKNLLSQLIPLATVHLVDEQLQELKSTYNLLPISEFNNLIYKEIKDQPAPFIYERLGERYKHYFIDEFQDTSLLQWGNLIPLVENALAQSEEKNQASLMLVGDAKQSIYRWRGGLPEQFIKLYSGYNPFPFVKQQIIPLDTNYRSCLEIIDFNNRFFSYLAQQFDDPQHQILYKEGNKQKSHHSCKGYVQLKFLEDSNADETLEIHSQEVVEHVKALLERGFQAGAICVLTRKRKEGIAVSEALSKNGLKVVSEETLLLKNAPKVKVLIDLLHLSMFPDDDEAKMRVLEFLVTELVIKGDEFHELAKSCIQKPLNAFENALASVGYTIQLNETHSKGVFETMEYFVDAFGLNKDADAFLVFFMDWIFQFSQNPMNSKWELLEFWELKKKELSIAVPNDGQAIRVMTIHKAKGLEFPIVIFPFAHLDIYNDRYAKAWYPYNKNGFEELPIRLKQEVESYGTIGAEIYQTHRSRLQLDNFNLLYVALTRAQQELYVIANEGTSKNEAKTYSDFFEGYLKNEKYWIEDQTTYEFGERQTPVFQEKFRSTSERFEYPFSIPKERGLSLVSSSHFLHNTLPSDARIFGSIFHEFMGEIKHKTDLTSAWEIITSKFTIPEDYRKVIFKTVALLFENATIKHLYEESETVENEKEIITTNGVVRPDRINFHENKNITLLDYKTGVPKEKDQLQLQNYSDALKAMGYSVQDSFLVYAKPEEIVVNKS